MKLYRQDTVGQVFNYVRCHEVVEGNGGIEARFLNLGTRRIAFHLQAPETLCRSHVGFGEVCLDSSAGFVSVEKKFLSDPTLYILLLSRFIIDHIKFCTHFLYPCPSCLKTSLFLPCMYF
jgi:hypothetical protein